MSNENASLDDLINQVASEPTIEEAIEQRKQLMQQQANTQVAVQTPTTSYSLDEYLNDTAGEVGAYLKIKEVGVQIKEAIFTELVLRVKVAELNEGGSFRPFYGLNNSDGANVSYYAKSYDRGNTVSECSDGAYIGRSWADYVSMRQVQFPKNKPFLGLAIRGEVVRGTGLKPSMKAEEGLIVGYPGTYMTSKPITELVRQIKAKGWEGMEVLVEMSGKEAKGNGGNVYAMPTFKLLGLDDGTI